MDKFMDFQFGWLNKEKLITILGVCILCFGLFAFLTGDTSDYSAPEEVLFNPSESIMTESFPAFPVSVAKSIVLPSKPRELFLLLDAPQLEMEAPEPPVFGVPVVLPPAYPQPSSKGNKNTDNGGK